MEKVAATTTSVDERWVRRAMGLNPEAALTSQRRPAVTWAALPPSGWATLWFYYWNRFGEGVPKGANKAKWRNRFDRLASEKLLITRSADRKDTPGAIVERLYAYLHSRAVELVNSKEYRMNETTLNLDWVKICGVPFYS